MTSEERVKAQYREAEHWVVQNTDADLYEIAEPGGNRLGLGESPTEAWDDAASLLPPESADAQPIADWKWDGNPEQMARFVRENLPTSPAHAEGERETIGIMGDDVYGGNCDGGCGGFGRVYTGNELETVTCDRCSGSGMYPVPSASPLPRVEDKQPAIPQFPSVWYEFAKSPAQNTAELNATFTLLESESSKFEAIAKGLADALEAVLDGDYKVAKAKAALTAYKEATR